MSLTHEQLLSIRDLTLWGQRGSSGLSPVSRYDDPIDVMENLVARLAVIRNIVEKEVGIV